MNQDLVDAFETLQEATDLSRLITRAGGDGETAEAAREELLESGPWELEFPGNRTRAMGHALVYIEDLESVGIEASREYQHESAAESGTRLHRIDIVIESEEAGDGE